MVVDTFLQFLTLVQRLHRHAGALGMAPYQFIRIQVRRITGQEMQRQPTFRRSHIVLHDLVLMCRQVIDHQVHWLLAPVNQPFEQFDKQLTGKTALIGRKPERALGIDGRRRADALALSGPGDHRCVDAFGPGLSVHRIGAKTRFVPEIDFGFLPIGPCIQRQVGIALSA